MDKQITPIITVTSALQAVFECLDQLSPAVPAHKREAYAETLARVRRARVELHMWVEEQRG
jgi:hypothetical protein